MIEFSETATCLRCKQSMLVEDEIFEIQCRPCRMFIEHPRSEEIARMLDIGRAEVCAHKRNPCFLRCGVERRGLHPWQVIPYEERIIWLEEPGYTKKQI